MLVWPHRHSDWSGTLEGISQTYLQLAAVISARQAVWIVHYDQTHKHLIERACMRHACRMARTGFVHIKTDDTWVRDYGPQILHGDQQYQYLDLKFNAWGGQYPCRRDNLFAKTFYQHMTGLDMIDKRRCQYQPASIVIEGGNLDFDDNATLLTNIDCIKRNNSACALAGRDIKQQLKRQFFLNRLLSVAVPALQGDDTGGHIDTLARFIDNRTIVYAACDDSSHPDYHCLASLREQLAGMTNAGGQPYRLVPLWMPRRLISNHQAEYLPASYVNFVFINGAILVPLYNDEHDLPAVNTFKSICANRQVIGIAANHLLAQFGSLHCATLHIPARVMHESRSHSTA